MNCNTTHYRANSSSVPGDPTVGWSTGLDVPGLPDGIRPPPDGSPTAPLQNALQAALLGDFDRAESLFESFTSGDAPQGFAVEWGRYWSVIRGLRKKAPDLPPDVSALGPGPSAPPAARVCLLAALGALCHVRKDGDRAVTVLEAARGAAPTVGTADVVRVMLGLAHAGRGDLAAAADLADGSRPLSPDRSDPWRYDKTGELLLRLGRWADAAVSFERMLEIALVGTNDRVAAAAHYRFGLAARAGGRAAEAADAFTMSAALCRRAGLERAARQAARQAARDLAAGARPGAADGVFCRHDGEVTGVAVSPDGTRVATSSTDHTVRVWDASTGAELFRLVGHRQAVNAVAFSADGTQLASGSAGRTVRIWDPATGQQVETLWGHQHWVNGVAYSPTGRGLASASDDGTVGLWGPALHQLSGHTGAVYAVAFTPDGRRVVSASGDGTCRVWDVETRREVGAFREHARPVRAVAVSPDGRLAASASEDCMVVIWALPGCELVTHFTSGSAVLCVAFSPDGEWVAAAGEDPVVRLANVSTREVLPRYAGHTGAVRAVAFSPDGRHLYSGSADGTVRRWDLPARAEPAAKTVYLATGGADVVDAHKAAYEAIERAAGVRCVQADGLRPADHRGDRHRRLVGGCDLFVAVLGHQAGPDLTGWEYETAVAAGRPCHVYLTPIRDGRGEGGWAALRLLVRDNGHHRTFFGRDHLADRVGRAVARLTAGRPDLPEPPGCARSVSVSHLRDEFRRIAWSPDGRLLAAASERRLRVWDFAGRNELMGLTGGQDVSDVAFAPDGSRLAACSGDGAAVVWDVAAATAAAMVQGHTAGFAAVAWSRDGDAVALGADDGLVTVLDPRTGGELGSVVLPEGVHALAWSPATGAVAAVCGGTCRLFNPGQGGGMVTLLSEAALIAVAWAPDGKLVFTAGRDVAVRAWDSATGRARFALEGHTDAVVAVAVSPDGKLLASASWDDTVRLWDLAKRTEVARLPATTALLLTTGLAFSPDGRRLATLGDESRAIDVWDLDRAVLLAEEPSAEAANELPAGIRQRADVPCPDGEFRRVAWSPDGRHLATGGDRGVVRRWDVGGAGWLPDLGPHPSDYVLAVAWSPDGGRVAAATAAAEATVWRVADPSRPATLPGQSGGLHDVAWSPDGRHLATAGQNGRAYVWDVDPGSGVAVLGGHTDAVAAVAWSPDGRRLATAGEDGSCNLFDPADGFRLTGQLRTANTGPLYAALWVSNGSFVAAGQDGVIRTWDAATGTLGASYTGHTDAVVALAVDRDGGLLASLSRDRTVRLWRTDTAACVAVVPLRNRVHLHLGLAFHPREPWLAVADGPRAVRVWELDRAVLLGGGSLSPEELALIGPLPDGYRVLEPIPNRPSALEYTVSRPNGTVAALRVVRRGAREGVSEWLRRVGFFRAVCRARHPNIDPLIVHLRGLYGERLDDEFYRTLVTRDAPPDFDVLLFAPVPRPTLLERLDECVRNGQGAVPPAELLGYVGQIADALDYLNQTVHDFGDGTQGGIAHGTVWGNDIHLADGQARLCLSSAPTVFPPDGEGPVTGYVPAYAAPEVWAGRVSGGTDQYALAVTYFQMRTGRLPFNEADALMAHAAGGWDPMYWRWDAPGLPATVVDVLRRATSRRLRHRYPTCREMVEALRAAEGLAAARPRAAVWHLALDASADRLAVGDPLAVTLRLHPDAADGRVPLAVPDDALELTAYVEADGFHLDGGHVRSVPVVAGRPAELAVDVSLTAVASGEHTVRVQVYPGRPADGARPVEVTRTVAVAAPAAPPGLRELLDRRAVPDPVPDVTLFAAVEEDPDGPRLAYHLSAPALGLDRKRLESVSLTPADLAGLRREATRVDGESVRAFGNLLFDRLLPPGHELRRLYWKLHDASRDDPVPWTWLVVADAAALAPWEMVAPYYVRDGAVRQDRFLGERFAVSHWVGRRGLPLAADVPVGRIDLAHYGPPAAELARWRAALGEDVHVCDGPGRLTLTDPGSPSYGLHVLRVARPAGPLIAEYEAAADDTARPLVEARRLDVTLKRPVAGLSLADGRPESDRHRPDPAECRLEAGWVLPLLHAGATAVAGPRWPVDGAADRAFWRAFHRAVRDGAALGQAAHAGRLRARDAAPDRADWLAFALFAHPTGRPYVVRPARGFTFVESLDEPADGRYRPGGRYRFRASYRSEPPTWYEGKLRVREEPLDGDGLSVLAAWLRGDGGVYEEELRPVPGGRDFQAVLTVTVPAGRGQASLLVSFRRGDEEEVQKVYVKVQLAEGG